MNELAVQDQKKVFSFLQAQIDNQRQQTETNQVMLNEMLSIRNEVSEIRSELKHDVTVMTAMVQEVRESVTLTDAECYDLQSAVHVLSTELAKEHFSGEEVERKIFSQQVGVYRRGIWKMAKERYAVAKYSHIRRGDFKSAMEFVGTIRMRDFVNA